MSDFAHHLAFQILDIEFYNDKRLAENIKKWITSIKARKSEHYYELVKFIIVTKVLFIGPFRFLRSNIFFEFVWWFGTSFFWLIW